jgi:hypothetical protein
MQQNSLAVTPRRLRRLAAVICKPLKLLDAAVSEAVPAAVAAVICKLLKFLDAAVLRRCAASIPIPLEGVPPSLVRGGCLLLPPTVFC